jgi:hypothetical protein
MMIDEGNRESLEIVMGFSVPSRRVTRALGELVAVHGPSAVRVDNGAEFTAQAFVDWCTEHGLAERGRILGGTHTVDSLPGQGTTITVTLDVREPRQERSHA